MSCRLCGGLFSNRIELAAHLSALHADDRSVTLKLTEGRSLVIQADNRGLLPCHTADCDFIGTALMFHEHLATHNNIRILATLPDQATVRTPTRVDVNASPTYTAGASPAVDSHTVRNANLAENRTNNVSNGPSFAKMTPESTRTHHGSNRTSGAPILSVTSDPSAKTTTAVPDAQTPVTKSTTLRFSPLSSTVYCSPSLTFASNSATPTSRAFSPPYTPSPASSGSYLTSIKVCAARPSVSERLAKAALFVHHFSGVCVFHFLTNALVIVDHQTFNDCDYGFGIGSHYQTWRKGINFRASACYLCGCPYKSPCFEHSEKIGRNCPHRDWQEFVRPLAYTVFHAHAIKQAVFTHLGIATDAFISASDYARWLGYRSGGIDKMSNLMEIVYSVAELHDNRTFPENSDFEIPDDE